MTDTPVVGRIEFSLGGKKYELTAPDLTAFNVAVTTYEIKALRDSIEGWRQIEKETGKGTYFVEGWGGIKLRELLAKLESMGVK